jgi:hypothetical protein
MASRLRGNDDLAFLGGGGVENHYMLNNSSCKRNILRTDKALHELEIDRQLRTQADLKTLS